MDNLVTYISSNHLGDLSSVVGLVLTIIGFAITIVNVRKSRKAAQEATRASEQVRYEMENIMTMESIHSVLDTMNEIKTLHRKNVWEMLPHRYTKLRESLINIKANAPDLTDAQKSIIQSAITNLRSFEDKVEKAIAEKGDPPDVPKFNKAISAQMDRLNELLSDIKIKKGR